MGTSKNLMLGQAIRTSALNLSIRYFCFASAVYVSCVSIAQELRFGIVRYLRLETFAWTLFNFSSEALAWVLNFSLGTLASKLYLRSLSLGTLGQELKIGSSRLEALAQELQLGNFSLVTFAQELQLRNFSSGTLAQELQLRNFSLGTFNFSLELYPKKRQLSEFRFWSFSLGAFAWELLTLAWELQLGNFSLITLAQDLVFFRNLAQDRWRGISGCESGAGGTRLLRLGEPSGGSWGNQRRLSPLRPCLRY